MLSQTDGFVGETTKKEKYFAEVSALKKKKNLPSFEQTPDFNFEKVKFCNSHKREKTVHMIVV